MTIRLRLSNSQSQKNIDTVALVAGTPGDAESLALGYLSAALKVRGIRPHVFTYRNAAELDAVARRILFTFPSLVGVSLQSGYAAIDGVALILLLRRLGYTGHITTGGAFATLCAKRLLSSFPQIDSVIPYDGELPLTRLAESICHNRYPESITGVHTRMNAAPHRTSDQYAFLHLHPLRDFFKQYAGLSSAEVCAARGYLSTIRRRPPEDLAEEMARLYHRHGIRCFHFVDENYLLPTEPDAIAQLLALGKALRKRNVGRRAISMMLKADIVTPRVAMEMKKLGVVRVTLEENSHLAPDLCHLKRPLSPHANCQAMRTLHQAGILFQRNILLVHPHSTIEQIQTEIAVMTQTRGGLIVPFALEVFENTDLYHQLEKRRRVFGGPFLWFYDLPDERAGTFAYIFGRLKRDAMAPMATGASAYEIQGALAASEHLSGIPPQTFYKLRAKAEQLNDKLNALWVSALTQAISLASTPDTRNIDTLINDTKQTTSQLRLRFNMLQSTVEACCETPPVCELSFPRKKLTAGIAAAVLGFSVATCQHIVSTTANSGADATAPVPKTNATDHEASRMIGTDFTAIIQPDTAEDTADNNVATRGVNLQRRALFATATENGCCQTLTSEGCLNQNHFVLGADGHVVDIVPVDENGEELPGIDDGVKECLLKALASQTFPCSKIHC